MLAQLVAMPIARRDAGQWPLAAISSCAAADYVAFWDGKVRSTGREAASGVYIYELVVDGERDAKKMFIAK